MDKKVIHSVTKKGSYDDDDIYYLEFDEEKGEYFVRHWWHHWRPNGIREGESVWSLEETQKNEPEVYQAALKEIQSIEELEK